MSAPNSPATKHASASEISLNQVIFPRDTNSLGMATAGVILKMIDIAASLAASRHCGKKIVTASLDRMDFINHAYLWELVTTRCRLTRTWRTSMEVEVSVRADSIRTDEGREVAKGYLVFVALDDETFTPTQTVGLTIESPGEIQLAQEADLRKKSRDAEKALLLDREQTRIQPNEVSTTMTRVMTPDDANIHDRVFGGAILELIHKAAERAATDHTGGPVISVRQDRMAFENSAFIGESVTARAIITRSWKTSMEIQVDVTAGGTAQAPLRTIASSYMVFVAQDSSGKPTAVTAFSPASPLQERRWHEAEVRRSIRMLERHSPA